jgi:hypothetical protein
MNREERHTAMREQFMRKAERAFEAAMVRAEHEQMDLQQIEEMVEKLRLELTAELVQSVVGVQEEQERSGPWPRCERCGREMRHKGRKRRQVVTSQGEITLERERYHCAACAASVFPPGSTVEGRA